MEKQSTKIALFEQKKIRKTWYKKEWYFSVADIIEALTETGNIRQYIKKLRKRDRELNFYWGTNCTPLEMTAKDGKKRKLTTANTEGVLRIIQSIPSPKAEPFKRWLAKVGYERIEEIENPELAQERMKKIYEAKGYSQDWIDKRLRGIAIRQNLTDEWKERGVDEQSGYAILTAEISKATFGMTPSQYKKFKNIPNKSKINLRDNMSDLELIFTMLGEKVTTEISKKEKPKGMPKNKKVAKRGGKVAGNARKETEKEIGRPVISKDNYLKIRQEDKRKFIKNRKNKK
jgi:hypothetical protein